MVTSGNLGARSMQEPLARKLLLPKLSITASSLASLDELLYMLDM